MADHALDQFIDLLASALAQAWQQYAGQPPAGSEEAAQADVLTVAGWQACDGSLSFPARELLQPRRRQWLELEMTLPCHLQACNTTQAGDGAADIALCMGMDGSGQQSLLTLAFSGTHILSVWVHLDGHLLRCCRWQDGLLSEGAADG